MFSFVLLVTVVKASVSCATTSGAAGIRNVVCDYALTTEDWAHRLIEPATGNRKLFIPERGRVIRSTPGASIAKTRAPSIRPFGRFEGTFRETIDTLGEGMSALREHRFAS